MDPDLWKRVDVVLDRVLAADRSSWPTLLDESCGTDHELRAQVEALLTRLPSAVEFLASPPSATASAFIAQETEDSPRVIPSEARTGGMSHSERSEESQSSR